MIRHYLSYDAAGNMVGVHAFGDSSGFGWPDTHALHEPGCEHPVVAGLRNDLVTRYPHIDGFAIFECDCSPTDRDCRCSSEHRNTHRYIGGQFVRHLDTTVTIDGVSVALGSTITKPPMSVLQLRIQVQNAPDGTIASVRRISPVAIMATDQIDLTTTNGETPAVRLIVPAQGLTAQIAVGGIGIISGFISVQGFVQ